MTEALKEWVWEHYNNRGDRGGLYNADEAAEFWLRHFCDEVEKIASAENKRLQGRQNYNDLTADAFQRVKHELLGL